MKWLATLCLLILLQGILALPLPAEIVNARRLVELTVPNSSESSPALSDDGLAICFVQFRPGDASNPGAICRTFAEATRPSLEAPFSNPTTTTFAAVISTTSLDSSPWMSNDRLRLYFASERDGVSALYWAQRNAPGEPFDAPLRLPGTENWQSPTNPRLANGERTLYFTRFSENMNFAETWRATRSDRS
jgi:hypothetical protein